jgi:hypothetical protein
MESPTQVKGSLSGPPAVSDYFPFVLITVCVAPAGKLLLKLLSPAYLAVSVFDPVVVNVSEHLPAPAYPVRAGSGDSIEPQVASTFCSKPV